MLNKIYLSLGGGLLAFYMASSFMGWELFSPERTVVPPSERAKTGWYRSPSFYSWHSGYRGGK